MLTIHSEASTSSQDITQNNSGRGPLNFSDFNSNAHQSNVFVSSEDTVPLDTSTLNGESVDAEAAQDSNSPASNTFWQSVRGLVPFAAEQQNEFADLTTMNAPYLTAGTVITSPTGMRWGKYHPGEDHAPTLTMVNSLNAANGTKYGTESPFIGEGMPIQSPVDGEIVYAGHTESPTGYFVGVQDKHGNVHHLQHLQGDRNTGLPLGFHKDMIGMEIAAGEPVGRMGNSGSFEGSTEHYDGLSAGTHLDITVIRKEALPAILAGRSEPGIISYALNVWTSQESIVPEDYYTKYGQQPVFDSRKLDTPEKLAQFMARQEKILAEREAIYNAPQVASLD